MKKALLIASVIASASSSFADIVGRPTDNFPKEYTQCEGVSGSDKFEIQVSKEFYRSLTSNHELVMAPIARLSSGDGSLKELTLKEIQSEGVVAYSDGRGSRVFVQMEGDRAVKAEIWKNSIQALQLFASLDKCQ